MKQLFFWSFLLCAVWLTSGCGPESENEKNKKNDPKLAVDKPEEMGQLISQAAQRQLGSNLMRAIKEGGYDHAVSFCRVQAKSITDSVGFDYKAQVSRVSDKPRNPKNVASEEEMKYITYYKQALSQETDWSSKLIETSDSYTYYAPIITQALCLNCHGDPQSQINPKTLARLRSDYPQDKAVGYGLGELRGMWKIKWEKN
jgi:hypothetical protein